MTIDDVKIGDRVMICATGSFYSAVFDISETQFYLGKFMWKHEPFDCWVNKDLFFITRDSFFTLDKEVYEQQPEILAIHYSEIYKDFYENEEQMLSKIKNNDVKISNDLLKEIIEYMKLGKEKWNEYSQSKELDLLEKIEKETGVS